MVFGALSCKNSDNMAELPNTRNNLILDSCIGTINNQLLEDIVIAYEKFLVDNHFKLDTNSMLDAYKTYLNYWQFNLHPDTGWVHDVENYEKIIKKLEASDLMEKIYRREFQNCLSQLDYCDTCFMNIYTTLMPKHNVSMQRVAQEFTDVVLDKEFQDPVLRKIMALEFFLGMAINIARPEIQA